MAMLADHKHTRLGTIGHFTFRWALS